MKRKRKGLCLNLNPEADKDIIKRLSEVQNMQGYIKELIRTDISLDYFRKGMENGTVKVIEDGQCNNSDT